MYTAMKPQTQVVQSNNEQTFIVMGTLMQFLASPEQIDDEICVLRCVLPPRGIVPLHSHAEAEILYLIDGALEVFQSGDPSGKWLSARAGDVISIPGNVKHALRNSSSNPALLVTVFKEDVYRFLLDLAEPFDPSKIPAPPTPEAIQKIFATAERHNYWLGSAAENAAIGISLG
jgi:quercetin dioxygenase-like cupin family protein